MATRRSRAASARTRAAILAFVVAALIGGACQSSLHQPAQTRADTTTSHVSTATTRAPAAPSTPRRPPTTLTPRRPQLATSARSRLVPLTIAAPSHEDSYSRGVDFGGWIDVDGCKNTRAEVLIKTSQVPVTFTRSTSCTVKTGRWTDPWSGAVTMVAHDFQIDHTVPLANAWYSGAWSWTATRRIAYANDFADIDHLVPILTSENEAKGDRGPDEWKPPNQSAWCRYALAWDHIKAKWHLNATPTEWNAITSMATTC